MNIPLSEVCAFGDGDNDKELLEHAGKLIDNNRNNKRCITIIEIIIVI